MLYSWSWYYWAADTAVSFVERKWAEFHQTDQNFFHWTLELYFINTTCVIILLEPASMPQQYVVISLRTLSRHLRDLLDSWTVILVYGWEFCQRTWSSHILEWYDDFDSLIHTDTEYFKQYCFVTSARIFQCVV